MDLDYLNYLNAVEIKDTKGNKTGSGFMKNDEFLIKDYLKRTQLLTTNNLIL